jgi:hypothetical protein
MSVNAPSILAESIRENFVHVNQIINGNDLYLLHNNILSNPDHVSQEIMKFLTFSNSANGYSYCTELAFSQNQNVVGFLKTLITNLSELDRMQLYTQADYYGRTNMDFYLNSNINFIENLFHDLDIEEQKKIVLVNYFNQPYKLVEIVNSQDPTVFNFIHRQLKNLSESDRILLFTQVDQYGKSAIDYCLSMGNNFIENLFHGLDAEEQKKLVLMNYINQPYKLVEIVNSQDPTVSNFIHRQLSNLSENHRMKLFTQFDQSGKNAIDYCLSMGNNFIENLFHGINEEERRKLIVINFNNQPFEFVTAMDSKSKSSDFLKNLIINMSTADRLQFLTKKHSNGYSVLDRCFAKSNLDLLHHFSDQEKKELILANFNTENSKISIAIGNGSFDKLLNDFQEEAEKKELINLKQIFMLKKMAGHILGISEKNVDFNPRTNTYTKSTTKKYEGLSTDIALAVFKEKLNSYNPSESFQTEFEAIRRAFSIIDYDCPFDPLQRQEQLHKYVSEYSSAGLIVIPSGWIGHSVTLAATKDRIIIANRGEKADPSGGCVIYTLENPLTQDQIFSLMTTTTYNDFKNIIQSLTKHGDRINFPDLFYSVSSIKDQSRGTCSIANKKAVIAGLLVLLKANSPDNEELIRNCMDEYKKFTNHIRQVVLLELTSELRENLDLEDELLEIFSDFCNEHLDVFKKKELLLIYEIISHIPDRLKADFNARLTPEALWVVSTIQKEGIDYSFPELLKDANYYRKTDSEKSKNFTQSLIQLVNQESSTTEAYKWCTDYFDYLLDKRNFNILFDQINILIKEDRELFINAFLRYDGDKFRKLIGLMQENKNNKQLQECTKLLLNNFTTQEKIKLLSPSYAYSWLLRTSGDILKVLLDGINPDEVFKLFTELDKHLHMYDKNLHLNTFNQNLFEVKHEPSYYHALFDAIGEKLFISLINQFPDCIEKNDGAIRKFIESRLETQLSDDQSHATKEHSDSRPEALIFDLKSSKNPPNDLIQDKDKKQDVKADIDNPHPTPSAKL